jgi:hypothetical protein
VADRLAAVQIRYPSVPIVFCDTRALAEDWTYRFLVPLSTILRPSANAVRDKPDDSPRYCQGRPFGPSRRDQGHETEATAHIGAGLYERSEARSTERNGHWPVRVIQSRTHSVHVPEAASPLAHSCLS